MEKRKSWSCNFPNQDPGLCSRGQTVNFSCQAAVFSCCVSDSLVTNEPFIPLRRSSLLFLPLVSALLQLLTCQQHLCCGDYRHRNRDFSVNSLIGDTCAGLPSCLINVPHFHTLLSFPDLLSLSFLSFILLSLSALCFFLPPFSPCSLSLLPVCLSGTVDCCVSLT